MKYLLLAIMVYANGETSGMMPTSWFDDEAACVARGEEFRGFAFEEHGLSRETDAVHFDCIGLTSLEIMILDGALPYQMPGMPD